MNKTKNNLSALVEKSIKELEPRAKAKSIEIITDLDQEIITRFEKNQIQEVMGNLLTNAIKYTPRHGTIEIAAWKNENYITVSVKDNGIGLTDKEKEGLFQRYKPFQRDFPDLGIEEEGTGLGLYFSKKIIERHEGRIWAESEGRNRGTTFYFTLPLLKE